MRLVIALLFVCAAAYSVWSLFVVAFIPPRPGRLAIALETGDVDVVENEIIRKGIANKPLGFTKHGYGCYPIHIALSARNTVVVNMLLEAGANPNCINNNGLMPLALLSFDAGPDHRCTHAHACLRAMLAHGADPRIDGAKQALHNACLHKNFACVVDLLEAGADASIVIQSGTALHHVATCIRGGKDNTSAEAFDDSVKIARLLLKAGVDVNTKNGSGKTALEYAVECNNRYLTDVLRAAARNPEQ